MPRNSSGVYTLPSAAFTPNTTISSSAVNANFSDIATALTGSLPVTGNVPMTGPLLLAVGSVTSPSISFSVSTNSGFYLIGAGNVGLALNGVLAVSFNSDLTTTWAGGQTITGNQSVSGNSSIGGTSAITGTQTVGGDQTVTGNSTVTGNQSVGGAVTFTSPNITLSTSKLMLSQCRLTLSGGNLLLSPFQGNMLYINGQNFPIPSAGITLGNGTTALSTLYYIYAYINSGTMTLEASTTAKETNTTTGWVQKTGDASRTLVGLAYTTAGNAWADTDGNRLTLSFFNRKTKKSFLAFTGAANFTRTASTFAEISTGLRNTFITWGDEEVRIRVYAPILGQSLGGGGTVVGLYETAIGLNNTTSVSGELTGAGAESQTTSVNVGYTSTSIVEGTLTYATALARTIDGFSTGVWQGSTAVNYSALNCVNITVETVG